MRWEFFVSFEEGGSRLGLEVGWGCDCCGLSL